MARITGRLLTLEIDSTDYSGQASNAAIASAESDADFLSFAEAAAGGARDYNLNLTVAQDLAAGSLFREIIDNVGDTVPFVIAPYGNETPTAEQPHVVGNAVIQEPDGDFIGGASTTSTSGAHTTEVSWPLTARFTLDTGA